MPDPTLPTEHSPHSDSLLIADLVRYTTIVTAAGIVADRQFPYLRDFMPRILPLANANAGHQVLLDYGLLQKLVWGAAIDLGARLRSWVWTRISILALAVAALSPILFWSPIVGTIIVTIMTLRFLRKYIAMRSSHKFGLVRDILLQNFRTMFDCYHSAGLRGIEVGWTTGLVHPNVALLIHEFPELSYLDGIGYQQFRDSFPCRATDGSNNDRLDVLRQLERCLTEQAPTLHNADTVAIIGKVLFLDSESMRPTMDRSSRWTGRGNDPALTIAPLEPGGDDDILYREAIAVQVLLADHMTAATFIWEVSLVRGALILEVCFLTMGPPLISVHEIEDRLSELQFDAKWGGFGLRHLINRAERELYTEPLNVAPQSPIAAITLPLKYEEITPLRDLFSASILAPNTRFSSESTGADMLRAVRRRWIARYTKLPNLRRNSSWPHPVGWNAAGAVARIRAAYELMMREVLLTIGKNGYDISQYYTESAGLSINAEQIGNLIVGERVSIRMNQRDDDDDVDSVARPRKKKKKPRRR